MKLVPYHGVLVKEYVGEILKSFDKFQVGPSSMKVFTTDLNGPLSPTVSRPSEGRADHDGATPLAPANDDDDDNDKKKPKKTKASPLKMLLPNGPLTRNANLLVAHAPGILGKFSPSSRLSYTDMHHGTCVTHAPWCKPGSLTSSFLWSRRREKHSRHFRCMHNPQFCIFGKRPMDKLTMNHVTSP